MVSLVAPSPSAHSRKELVADLIAMVKPEQVLWDDENQRPFECDGLAVYKQMPWITVIPDTSEQVQDILAYCYKQRIPVVVRGAGTGLCAVLPPMPVVCCW